MAKAVVHPGVVKAAVTAARAHEARPKADGRGDRGTTTEKEESREETPRTIVADTLLLLLLARLQIAQRVVHVAIPAPRVRATATECRLQQRQQQRVLLVVVRPLLLLLLILLPPESCD